MQFAFAERLFEEGDYYRAIGEYKRYIFLYPQEKSTEKAFFRIAESYYRAEKWKEATDAFKKFVAKYPASTLCPDTLYQQGLSEKQLHRFDDAFLTFEILSKIQAGRYFDKAIYEMALILVEKEDWSGARNLFTLVPGKSALYGPAQRYYIELDEIENLPRKSPAAAGTLAAILPGAGHLYAERPRDALVAFLLNASFIWASIELFNNGNEVAGGIVAFFELGWYTGNIYSAVGSAHKYNERNKKDFLQNLKDMSSLSFYKDGKSAEHYLMYCVRYQF
ncbi:MAG: tetratricopeptide repeat protein [Deltaproteobacteria bacterium]|nr:tetratricopeptide repeat protein [Deltaproteobacteria bacterium]